MADLYGSLVGTPKQGLGFGGIKNAYENGTDQVLVRDKCAVPAITVVTKTVSLGKFQSNAIVNPGADVWYEAFGAGVTLDIGDVTYPHGIKQALDISAAGSAKLFAAVALSLYFEPLWKVLGYAADPGGLIELLATFGGASTTNAIKYLNWQLSGHR